MLFGAVDSTAVTTATDAATSLKDTGTAVILALIPLSVGFILVRKALPWARKMLHI
jgi:hypothetical protein